MILSSYFFSVSGIVALYILGLYEYLNNKKVKFKDIINYTFNIAIRFLNAVLISAILMALFLMIFGVSLFTSGIFAEVFSKLA